MMSKVFNSGFLVSFASAVVEKKLLDETTIKYTFKGALMAVQTGCLGALHREQSLTALNRCGMLVFNKIIIWNVLKVMISTRK